MKPLGPESQKSFDARVKSGFFTKYCSGSGLDIGYGGSKEHRPILNAIGVDALDQQDAYHLVYNSGSLDYVYSSHCLEHLETPTLAIKEWFRVLRVGGHLVIIVPHMDLYEKKSSRPSKWNLDHKKFYRCYDVLLDITFALPKPNSWRLRHMRDNDDGYNYEIGPEWHSQGCFEIECVIQKIQPPKWEVV